MKHREKRKAVGKLCRLFENKARHGSNKRYRHHQVIKMAVIGLPVKTRALLHLLFAHQAIFMMRQGFMKISLRGNA